MYLLACWNSLLVSSTQYAVVQYNPFGDLKTYRDSDNRVFNDSNGSIIALGYGVIPVLQDIAGCGNLICCLGAQFARRLSGD